MKGKGSRNVWNRPLPLSHAIVPQFLYLQKGKFAPEKTHKLHLNLMHFRNKLTLNRLISTKSINCEFN
jgi:hypothetical protein